MSSRSLFIPVGMKPDHPLRFAAIMKELYIDTSPDAFGVPANACFVLLNYRFTEVGGTPKPTPLQHQTHVIRLVLTVLLVRTDSCGVHRCVRKQQQRRSCTWSPAFPEGAMWIGWSLSKFRMLGSAPWSRSNWTISFWFLSRGNAAAICKAVLPCA